MWSRRLARSLATSQLGESDMATELSTATRTTVTGATEELRAAMRGQVLQPGDEGYDAARQIWNGMIDRHPALIARCTGAADVLASVRVAREHGLLVSVRGGGHNVAGLSVCDDGLMIDLSLMKSI